MKIKILGTRGEIEPSAPYHSHQSGVLIDKKILFDLGEREFLKYNPKYIFITHLHPDHAVFIEEEMKQKIKAPVFAPEKHSNQVEVKKMEKAKKINSYKIVPIPTIHSKKLDSQAYLIKKGKQKILYTGDMIWMEKKHHDKLKDLDLVITEGSFIRKGGIVRRDEETGKISGHTGIPNLINLFKKFTDNILFIHFGSWFYKNIKDSRKKLKGLGRKNKVNVLIGYDGMDVDVSKL
jgi:ribonuclease BN (tRNA processing enzyme)